MNNCKIAKFILSLFPAVLVPANDFLLEGKAFQRCKNASCMESDCHGLPKSIANHFVVPCTLYIVAHTTSKSTMAEVYRSILHQIKDWSVMDKTHIWNNSSRPVWFQCLVDVILPTLKICVQSLCLSISESISEQPDGLFKDDKVQGGKADSIQKAQANPANMSKNDLITQWIIELLNTLTETLSVIPRGFFFVCEDMDDLIPRKYLPVRNNVPVHFLVTGLYMLLQIGSGIAASILPSNESEPKENGQSKKPDKPSNKGPEKTNTSKNPSGASLLEPYLFSLAERLCHLDDPVFDQAIHRLISQVESM